MAQDEKVELNEEVKGEDLLDGDEAAILSDKGDEPAAEEAPAEEVKEEAAPVEEAAPDEPAAEETTAQPEAEPAHEEEPPPVYNESGTLDYKPKWDVDKLQNGLQQVEAKLAEIKKAYRSGDLAVEEYEDQRDNLINYRIGLSAKLSEEEVRKEIFDKVNASAAAREDAHWAKAQSKFFKDNPDWYNDDVKFNALQAAVHRVWNHFETNAERLQAAQYMVEESFGIGGGESAVPITAPKAGVPKAAKPAIPKTVATMPAAAANNTGGKFAHLKNLTGEALEDAIGKMSEREKEDWAASSEW